MAELKPCEYCEEIPELQKGIEFMSMQERFRYHCPRCNITSKSAYTIWGAIEAWNRRAKMREILFRGQTRKYGEKVRMGDGQKLPGRWVYGGVLQGAGSHSIIYGGENENDPGEGLDKWCVHTDTLGQYTGLRDKNGKRIFEGDIIKDDWGKIYKVIFTTTSCGFMVECTVAPSEYEKGKYRLGDAWCKTIAVVGNIHDNSELLEGGTEDGK